MDFDTKMSDGTNVRLTRELITDMQEMHDVNAKYEVAKMVYPGDKELAQELERRLERIMERN